MNKVWRLVRGSRRNRYFVDARLQLALVAPLLGILALVGVAYVAAIYLLPGEAALKTMTVRETRTLFLRANVVYFAIALAAVGAAAVYVTHRIAGPAGVIERAVRAMQRGDYRQRLRLRPRDYLQTLAAAVRELRGQLVEESERRQRLLEELAARLAADDREEAHKLLVELGLTDDPPAPDGAAGPR